ncbi:hypothetical protein [Streptomyces bambusae]|uniref:Methylamine utilization protein MauE n=1 Tax=Streptomyces bambusae TaxID=1550616 RepID=A0ABS6Z0K9_9ACTN|nr:hypothetical protein [Streptomyces bambusae]MBW5481279.1 hypothetical protein [Streptomyces bambusae]
MSSALSSALSDLSALSATAAPGDGALLGVRPADLALALVAGPLAVAGAAKLVTAPEKLSWPLRSGLLAAPAGPRLVGTAELASTAAVVLLPVRWGAAVACLAYAVLTVVAARTRGQKCACFGLARLAAVGRAHIGLNAAAALLAGAVLALSDADARPLPRAAATAATAALTLAALLTADRRRARAASTAPPCTAQVRSVRLYVADDCPSCRSLKHLLSTGEPERLAAVTMVTVAKEAELPGALHGLGVPCATGLDASGTPVCAPASGIGAVKALIDGITLASVPAVPADHRAG